MSERMVKTKKNVIFSYLSNIIITILSFVLRTIFISILNEAYLGVNGLFTGILSVLSFAELGIGNVMNFALYKPVADNDKEKIKSLMKLYKKAYYWIAAIIAGIGLCLLPFLNLLIKDPGNVGNIKIYYLIYLFNTVITYFVSYKHSIANAEQKNYIVSIINSIAYIATSIAQIITLVVFKKFLVYLLTASFVLIVRLIIENNYFDKKYPILKEKDIQPLDNLEYRTIKDNVKALVIHKISGICIDQTDTILLSFFSGLSIVGLMSNYKMIMNAISTYIASIFTSTVSTLGNIVATETKDAQLKIFNTYNFINFWIYGFSSLAFYFLLSPTIALLWGKKMLIDNSIVLVICLNFYIQGELNAFCNFKAANGSFVDDKYIVLFSSLINLVFSIILCKKIGLVGIYIGSTITILFQLIVRPAITYESFTSGKRKDFFVNLLKYFISIVLAGILIYLSFNLLSLEYGLIHYIIKIILVTVIPNALFFIMYNKSSEFKLTFDIIKNGILKKHGK